VLDHLHQVEPILPRRIHTGGREPSELNGENELEDHGRHERRDAADEERRGVDEGVEPSTGLAAGENAHTDADTDTQYGGGAGEAERVEERVPQRLPHFAAALDALRPGVRALQELAEPLEVPPHVAPEAGIEAVGLDELVDLLLARPRIGPGIRSDRVEADPAGDVHEERHDQDRRDHPQQSPNNESRHSLPPSGESLI
jgi:hypothetical protein